MHTYRTAGARVIELSDANEGNWLNASSLQVIESKLRLFEDNIAATCVVITSESPDLFSEGICLAEGLDEQQARRKENVTAANKILKYMQGMKTPIIVVCSGLISSTAFGPFALAEYRLGTMSTRFCIGEDLSKGYLPLGGAVAYFISRGCEEGVAMARYLAISQRSISAHDMRCLGLLTHIVEDEPHNALLHGLGHTIDDTDAFKAYQPKPVDVDMIDELLDIMDSENDHEMSVMDSPLWDKHMLVRPEPISEDIFFDDDSKKEDLEDIAEEVQYVFQSDDIEECRTRLQATSSPWAQGLVERMNNIGPEILVSWFKLTSLAAENELATVCMAEEVLL